MSDATYFPLNLTIVQGDDVPMTFLFSQDGVPLDISSWLFYYTAKAAYDDVDASAKITVNPTAMTLSASIPAGTVDKLTFVLPKASTVLMAAGYYYQDLQVIRTGLVTTLGRGLLVVEAQVTIRNAP
jgi:hypothetical protein